jgi:hypothetical protein
VGDGVGVGVGDGVGDGVGVGDGDGVGIGDGVGDGVGIGEGVLVTVGFGVGVALDTIEYVTTGVGLPDFWVVAVGSAPGLTDCVAEGLETNGVGEGVDGDLLLSSAASEDAKSRILPMRNIPAIAQSIQGNRRRPVFCIVHLL